MLAGAVGAGDGAAEEIRRLAAAAGLVVTIAPATPPRRGSRRGNGEGNYWTRRHPPGHPRAGRVRLYGWTRVVGGVSHQATATTQAALRERVADLQAALRAGDAPAPGSGRTTVHAYATDWLATLDKRPSTVASYRNFVENHLTPELGDVLLRDLTGPRIRRFLASQRARGLARTTLALHATLLGMILTKAQAESFPVPAAALKAIERPSLPRGGRGTLTVEQVKKLLALDDQYTPLWCLLLFGGLRIGELLGLRWGDFADEGTWRQATVVRQLDPDATITKYLAGVDLFPELKSETSRRTIVLPASASRQLVAHHARQEAERFRAMSGGGWMGSDLVVCSPSGLPVLQSTARDWFALSCTAATLPALTPHACRRAYGDLLRLAGLDVRTIADLLGHASVDTTSQHYLSTLHPMALRAADGLEELFH